jgi:hypothetical protein
LALPRTDSGAAAPLRRGADARRRGLPFALDAHALLWVAPLGLAAAFLAVFVWRLPYNIAQLGWNSSVASAFVMPETLVRSGTGGMTVMGSTGQWASLWFGLLTARLPLHRELWGVTPTLLLLLTAGLLGWSVTRLAGARAAVLTVLICIVASVPALGFLMAPFSHNTVYPLTALLGAYLVWLAQSGPRGGLTRFLLPPLLGIVAGACLASDILLAPVALVPLGLTAILAAFTRDPRWRTVTISALVIIVVSLPVAKLTSTTMGSLGYVTLHTPFELATISELPQRAKLLFEGLQSLFNGYLGGSEGPGTLHAPLGIACDVAMSIALLALVVVGIRTGARAIMPALGKRAVSAPQELARTLHVTFWTCAAAASCGAFWLAGEGPTTTHYSYYDASVLAVAAVIPLLLGSGRGARALIAIGTSVFFLGSLVGLTSDFYNTPAALSGAGRQLLRFARANDVRIGFGNWTDASGLTWGLHGQVTVRPVLECRNEEALSLCAGFQAYVPAWYTPHRGRSFLLVEAGGIQLLGPPPSFGRPLSKYHFANMTMYVYPYDIASHFGAPE